MNLIQILFMIIQDNIKESTFIILITMKGNLQDLVKKFKK